MIPKTSDATKLQNSNQNSTLSWVSLIGLQDLRLIYTLFCFPSCVAHRHFAHFFKFNCFEELKYCYLTGTITVGCVIINSRKQHNTLQTVKNYGVTLLRCTNMHLISVPILTFSLKFNVRETSTNRVRESILL